MQRDPVADFHVARDRLIADAGMAQFLFGILRIDPEHVDGHLAVDGDRLQTLDDRRAGAFEHRAPQSLPDPIDAPTRQSGDPPPSDFLPALIFFLQAMTDPVRCGRLLWLRLTLCVLLAEVALSGQAPALPNARDLVDRHVAAIGGEAAFKALKSLRLRGRFEITGQSISAEFEQLAARPDRLLLRADIPGVGHTEQGYDGKVGWSIDPQAGPKLLKGRELDETIADADFDGPLHVPERIKELTTTARTQFDGRDAYKVKVVLRSGVEQDEYFDAETGFEIGWEANRETQLGVLPTTAILRDYKKFGPVMQPTTLVQKMLFLEQVLHVASVEYDNVPPDTFTLPPSIRALIK
jgi:hypothetical protein